MSENMPPTEPGYTPDELRFVATSCETAGEDVIVDPASILALLDEVERLRAGREVEQEMLRNALPIIAELAAVRARLAAMEALFSGGDQ